MKNRIVVAIPCLNEARTIGKVIADFQRALPEASILVVDNGSEDVTSRLAQAAGARVLTEHRRGKGWVLQTIFGAVDADVLVIVDGDDTYPAEAVRELIAPVLTGEADMAVGNRLAHPEAGAFGGGHLVGNRLIVRVLNTCFGRRFSDVLSGYRALSRRLFQEVPLITKGFEIETELTIQVLERGFVVREVPITYRPRGHDSFSKLRTFRDGYRIILTMIVLMRDHRPLVFFSLLALACVGIGLGTAVWALRTVLGSWAFHVVAMSATVVAGLAGLALFLTGLVLNTINTRFHEVTVLLNRHTRRHDA